MQNINKETESLKEKCYRFQKNFDYVLDNDKYIIAHIDGRSFSKMIKNKFSKPFDEKFIEIMNKTAAYLCEKVQGAQFAYTQSDEISILIKKNYEESQIFFGGRMCKLQSIIASLATAKFNQLMIERMIEEKIDDDCEESIYQILSSIRKAPLYQFDCKVWTVDTANDAFSWFLFRNIDCIRNSKQQTCQTYLSQSELVSKNADEQVELLKIKNGVDWNKFSDNKKYGRLIKKVDVTKFNDETEIVRHIYKDEPFYDLTNKDNANIFKKEFNFE